jgi:hypothetical protein
LDGPLPAFASALYICRSLRQRYGEVIFEWRVSQKTTITLTEIAISNDLSRFRAAPDARLGHFPFEGDRAFPD